VRRSSESGGGIPVAGVQEGDEKVVSKLLHVDVVPVVSSVRAKRGGASGQR
jgi:hypothetical protein